MARQTVASLNAHIAKLEATVADLNQRLTTARECYVTQRRAIDDLQTVVTHQKAELDLYQISHRPSRQAIPVQGQWPIVNKGGVDCYKIRSTNSRVVTYRPVAQ